MHLAACHRLVSLIPPTADLKCATSSLIYAIVIIFDARYLKSVSFNFLETVRNKKPLQALTTA